MSPVLKLAKIAITHLSLGLSPQNQKNFQGHENSLGQLIYKKSVAVAVLEKSRDTLTHTRTHAQDAFYNLPPGLKPGGR